MSDESFLFPQDPEYILSLGRASFAFARLEWEVVWCCERLQTGYLHTVEKHQKTAGKIENDLRQLFERLIDTELRGKAVPIASEFKEIVKSRNGLIHGKPGTAENGDQRLFRFGLEWTTSKVDEFSNRCVRAEKQLNNLRYTELKKPSLIALKP